MITTEAKAAVLQLTIRSSKIHGSGLFAATGVPALSVICSEVPSPGPQRGLLHLEGPIWWANHSCRPNSVLKRTRERASRRTSLSLIALRDILEGEEITYDYNACGHRGKAVRCTCGEHGCAGFFYLRTDFGESA